MALNSDYVLCPSLQNYFVDKDTGAPLSGGFVYFFEDSNRTNPKDVYALTGSYSGGYSYTNLGNVLTLTNVGTFADNSGDDSVVYLYPFLSDGITPDLYFIQVYDMNGVFQFSRQAWPNTFSENAISEDFSFTDNIISNPQFVNFLYPSNNPTSSGASVTLSLTGTNTTTLIAPDWYLVTNGTGSITYQQTALGVSNSPSNPSYCFQITASSGFNQNIILQQRFSNTARIFANDYVNGYFECNATDSSNHLISMTYVDTNNNVYAIGSATTPSSNNWITGQLTALINSSTTGTAPASFDYINISIPVAAAVAITSVQVIGVPNADSTAIFLQKTSARQVDELFHYYQPQLNFKPIESLLCAWDFATNPAQFFPNGGVTINTTSAYVWDQTIMRTSSGSAGVTFSPTTQSMIITSGATSQAIMCLQYLQNLDAVRTTLSNLSANINAYSITNGGVVVQVFLLYGNSSSVIPSIPSTVCAPLSTGALTSIATNWTVIPQLTGHSNIGTLPISAINDIGFSGWIGTTNYAGSSVNNFAIAVTFAVPTSGTVIVLNSISLVPGDIPTRPAPELASDVLRQCQYYWETSYPAIANVGTAVSTNALTLIQNSLSLVGTPSAAAYPSPFTFQYQQIKRAIPNITFYDTSAGTSASVTSILYYALTETNAFTADGPHVTTINSYWNVTQGLGGCQFVPKSASNLASTDSSSSTVSYSSASVTFQYVADARLGIV